MQLGLHLRAINRKSVKYQMVKLRVQSPAEFRRYVAELDDDDAARFQFCSEIGSTFVVLNKMEHDIIWAITMCDKIKLSKVLGGDADNWHRMISKRETLEDSTLGSLIAILSRHNVAEEDLRYLRWLKNKRDYFIHRFFRRGVWPGDMSLAECEATLKSLRYLEFLFHRCGTRIWKILANAGLIELEVFSDGMLASNIDLASHFGGHDELNE